MNAGSSTESALMTFSTASALPQHFREVFLDHARKIHGQIAVMRLNGLLAIRTDRSDEALRHDAFHRTRNQERFDTHVDQTGESTGRIIGVQRAEDEVP